MEDLAASRRLMFQRFVKTTCSFRSREMRGRIEHRELMIEIDHKYVIGEATIPGIYEVGYLANDDNIT